jgi:hypothetical protein
MSHFQKLQSGETYPISKFLALGFISHLHIPRIFTPYPQNAKLEELIHASS